MHRVLFLFLGLEVQYACNFNILSLTISFCISKLKPTDKSNVTLDTLIKIQDPE